MTKGTWDEQEDELIKKWKAREIDTKALMEGFAKLDKQRLIYIK